MVERSGKAEFLDIANAPVEGKPAHDLGISEMAARAAHLPKPFIGLLPDRFEMFQKFALERPIDMIADEPARPALIERVEHFAVNIELQLRGRRIADANGL